LNKLLSQYNDEKLVELYTQGNESALEELINRYQQKVFAYILMVVHDKDLAEDLFQDTFIKVINTLKLGLYREEGKFNQWLMRITRNLVIDHFRRCQKMSYVDNHETGDIFDSFSEPSMSIEQTMIMQQIYDSLHELISFLPEEQNRYWIYVYTKNCLLKISPEALFPLLTGLITLLGFGDANIVAILVL